MWNINSRSASHPEGASNPLTPDQETQVNTQLILPNTTLAPGIQSKCVYDVWEWLVRHYYYKSVSRAVYKKSVFYAYTWGPNTHTLRSSQWKVLVQHLVSTNHQVPPLHTKFIHIPEVLIEAYDI